MSHADIKKKIEKHLNPIASQLDAEANEIIKDLLKRIRPFKQIVPNRELEKELPGSYCVLATGGGVAFTPHDVSSELGKGVSSFFTDNDQFVTFEENRRYCEGTEGLLGLLTRYHSVVTSTAKIRAVPDVHVWEQGRAVFREEHREDYGDERYVHITIESPHGMIMFAFEEKVDKKNKVREQKVY